MPPPDSARLTLRRWVAASGNARQRLICLPWCGAGASVFRALAQALSPGVEVLAVQLPGREERYNEPPLRRMSDVVALLADACATLDERPLALFGHSMGAVVAHELAQELRARGGPLPWLLVASGHAAPSHMRLDAARWHDADEPSLLRNLGALGGTPEGVLQDEPLMRALLPTMRADYEVLETYRWQPAQSPLPCRLVACAGRADEAVPVASLEAWTALSSAPGTVQWFDGGHFYLRDEPLPLLQALTGWLAEAPLTCGSDAQQVPADH